MKTDKRLGRGLDSLISKTTEKSPAKTESGAALPEGAAAPRRPAFESDTTLSHAPAALAGASPPVSELSLDKPDSAPRARDDIHVTHTSLPLALRASGSRMEAGMVRLEALAPNPFQPRRAITEESVQGLAESIRQTGLLQPVTVRKKASGDAQGSQREYELVAGERRWRAARLAGLREVPVIVRDVSDEEMVELALVENIQREDINPIDRARAYRQYCERFRRGLEHVARRMGEDRSTVSNFMRLLDLPDEVQQLVAGGQISAGHARAILSLEHPKQQMELAEQILKGRFSVRETEELARTLKSGRPKPGGPLNGTSIRRGTAKSPHLRDVEARMERACGTRVSIQEGRRKGQGKLVIEYYSLDDFERIAALLGVGREE